MSFLSESPDEQQVLLSCAGDPTHPDAWSSIPYHILDAGKPLGVVHGGIKLRPDTRYFKSMRYLWNLWNVGIGRGKGGFQYSHLFINALWKPVLPLKPCTLISHYQLLPAAVRDDDRIEKWFYVDATLTQLPQYYGLKVNRHIFTQSVREERAGYVAAEGIMTMSRFAADSVIRDYGIDPEKVHVVVPGANISRALYAQCEPMIKAHANRPMGDVMKILVIGKDWHRKGVDRVLDALVAGRKKGLRATVRVLGCDRAAVPARYRDIEGVDWTGFVSRRSDSDRFFKLVMDCDIGCLPSRAEFAGIALREYLALGMPVIGPDTGGSPDMMDPDCCRMVTPEAPPEAIADILLEFQNKPGMLAEYRKIAFERRHTRLWDHALRSAAAFWPQPHPIEPGVSAMCSGLAGVSPRA